MAPKERRAACKAIARKTYLAHKAPIIGTAVLLIAIQLLLTVVYFELAPRLPAALIRWAPAVKLCRMLVTLLVTAPLQFALYDLCLRLLKGESVRFPQIFLWVTDRTRRSASLRGQLFFAFLVFLPFIGLMIAWALGCSIIFMVLSSRTSGVLGTPVTVLSLLVVLAVCAVIALRRMFGVFGLVEHPDQSANQLSELGMEQSEPYTEELIWLLLSLLPLLIPAVIISLLAQVPGLLALSAWLKFLMLLASILYWELLLPYFVLVLGQFYRMATAPSKRASKRKRK